MPQKRDLFSEHNYSSEVSRDIGCLSPGQYLNTTSSIILLPKEHQFRCSLQSFLSNVRDVLAISPRLLSSMCFFQSYRWRSTYLFHKEDKELRRFCVAGIATRHMYIRGRFVKDFADVDGPGFSTLQLSNDASL